MMKIQLQHSSAILLAAFLAACGGETGTEPRVEEETVARLNIEADTIRVVAGQALQLAVQALGNRGSVMTAPAVAWTMRPLMTASVPEAAPPVLDAAGTLQARGLAAVMVTARSGTLADSAVVLTEPRAEELRWDVSAASLELSTGATLRVREAYAANGQSVSQGEGLVKPRWTSSNPQVVRVDTAVAYLGNWLAAYKFVAVAPGSATVRVAFGGKERTLNLVVRTVSLPALIPFGGSAGQPVHGCALAADGSAWCQGGTNFLGQLGTRTAIACSRYCIQQGMAQPVRAAGSLTFTSLSLGEAHACGLTQDGSAHCWGSNTSGQLGAPALDDACHANEGPPSGAGAPCSFSGVAVQGGLKFRTIEASPRGTCAVAMDNRRYCWGLGIGSTPTLQ